MGLGGGLNGLGETRKTRDIRGTRENQGRLWKSEGTRGRSRSDQRGLGGSGDSRSDTVASLGEWALTALCVLFVPYKTPSNTVCSITPLRSPYPGL